MIDAFTLYTLFTLASAVAANWPSLIVFRLMTGIGAACPIAVVGGLVPDRLRTSPKLTVSEFAPTSIPTRKAEVEQWPSSWERLRGVLSSVPSWEATSRSFRGGGASGSV